MKIYGTPKTLEKAIENALNDDTEKLSDSIRHHIRDFLAQKFQWAYLKTAELGDAELKCESLLKDLWNGITGEKQK
jgi:hypothetical protein